MHRTRLILILLFAICITAEAQNKVGMVVEITGTARLKDTSGKEQKLTSQNFVISLTAGQSLKADGSGKVRVKLCNGKNETVENRWYRVPQVICSSTTNAGKRKVLETVFDFGGRYKVNRSDNDFILFPVENDVTLIRPETAIFHWRTTTEKIILSIAIDGDARPVWSKAIDGAARKFTSDELKARLEEVRGKWPNAKLRLTLAVPSLGTENSATFQLYSSESEDNLQKELGVIGDEPAIYRYLARVEIFARYKLYYETANELDEALKLSPKSIELLKAASFAQDRAGNFKRRDDLDARLRAQARDMR